MLEGVFLGGLGLYTLFFQIPFHGKRITTYCLMSCDMVKEDHMRVVQEFYFNGVLGKINNSTFVTLLSKS